MVLQSCVLMRWIAYNNDSTGLCSTALRCGLAPSCGIAMQYCVCWNPWSTPDRTCTFRTLRGIRCLCSVLHPTNTRTASHRLFDKHCCMCASLTSRSQSAVLTYQPPTINKSKIQTTSTTRFPFYKNWRFYRLTGMCLCLFILFSLCHSFTPFVTDEGSTPMGKKLSFKLVICSSRLHKWSFLCRGWYINISL